MTKVKHSEVFVTIYVGIPNTNQDAWLRWLSHFNSQLCDERVLITKNMLIIIVLTLFNKLLHVPFLLSNKQQK